MMKRDLAVQLDRKALDHNRSRALRFCAATSGGSFFDVRLGLLGRHLGSLVDGRMFFGRGFGCFFGGDFGFGRNSGRFGSRD